MSLSKESAPRASGNERNSHSDLHEMSLEANKDTIMNRLRDTFKDRLTGSDELTRLYELGDKKHFNALLDDLTYEALSHDETFMRNAEMNNNDSIDADQAKLIKAEQQSIFNAYREEIAFQSGIPQGEVVNEIDLARQRVMDIVGDRTINSDTAAGEILNDLGMIEKDQDGHDIFVYPQGLFPESTDKKWNTYLETVREHLRIGRAVRAFTLNAHELSDADRIRRIAHNAVSRDIDEILGLSILPESEWTFEDTRRMVAKMRDNKYPTVETAEKSRTGQDIFMALTALKAINTRLSDLHKK